MTRYRVLQTGDLHVGRGRARWGEAVALDRASKMFDRIYAVAQEEKCHAVLLCGDIFDSKLVTIPERDLVTEKLFRYVAVEGIETFIISGNHDLTQEGQSNLDFLAEVSQSRAVPKLHVAFADKAEVWTSHHPGLRIVGAPVGISENQAPLEALVDSLDPSQSYIMMGHGTVGGSFRNDSNWRPTANEDASHLNLAKVAAKAPHVVLWCYGDIHKRQPLPGLPKTSPGWYAGSPVQMNFGETPNRGVMILALDSTPTGWSFVGKRYIQIDTPDAGFAELVTVLKEEQLDTTPKDALIRLAPGLILSAERREQVVSEFRVVDDESSMAVTDTDVTKDPETGLMQVFDPLLADIADVEANVLSDLPESDDAVVAEAKKVVGLAVERYRNRTYVS